MILGTILFILVALLWLFGIGIGLGLLFGPFVVFIENLGKPDVSKGVNIAALIFNTIVCWGILFFVLKLVW